MSSDPMHPITTPKGAAVVTIVSVVVSWFAPQFVSSWIALVIGLVAASLVIWIYWSEIHSAWREWSWSSHLTLPSIAIVLILIMAATSAQHAISMPQPTPVAEEVAQRVERWLEHHQLPIPQQQPAGASPSSKPAIDLLTPMSAPPAEKPRSRRIFTLPKKRDEDNTYKQLDDLVAKDNALEKCRDHFMSLSIDLLTLANKAGFFQNAWAYSRDGVLLRQQYVSWMADVKKFLAEHKDVLPDTSEFEQVKELDMGPTLLVIPSSGENAWRNFDARRKALLNIDSAFEKNTCKAEQAAADEAKKAADKIK